MLTVVTCDWWERDGFWFASPLSAFSYSVRDCDSVTIKGLFEQFSGQKEGANMDPVRYEA